MKFVIAGGSGQLGQILARHWLQQGHDVAVLARGAVAHGRPVGWDGQHLGPWAAELDGADVVVNLAGRTVNCRYTQENLAQMLSSRVDSTRVVGEAIAQAKHPPPLWLQMSTATLYAHRFDADNDELAGIVGGSEPDVPAYWQRSVAIAQAWERALDEAPTPHTRKVAMRTAMVMSPDGGGVFDVMLGLARKGLGGAAGSGKQYVSWIHDRDLVAAVEFVMSHTELHGPINFAAPTPLPQAEFARLLRQAAGVRVGLPALPWMLEVGAFFLRTDTELLLKSRRVVPKRLLDAGFQFQFPAWDRAVVDLLERCQVFPVAN